MIEDKDLYAAAITIYSKVAFLPKDAQARLLSM